MPEIWSNKHDNDLYDKTMGILTFTEKAGPNKLAAKTRFFYPFATFFDYTKMADLDAIINIATLPRQSLALMRNNAR